MKFDLYFSKPVMNAAGALGFTPPAHGIVDLAQMGAFITNPISQSRRTPAQGERYLSFPGGFLLHSGYPNPGLRAALKRYATRWTNSATPVFVHLLAQLADDIHGMARRLEEVEGLGGIELGLPPDVNAELAVSLVQAATGELPIIARLPLEKALELAPGVIAAGAAAISLCPPRGILPARYKMADGRLYGPAIFPQALLVVRTLARQGLPVIGAGGIYSTEQIQAMLDAGALAIQLDSVLWRSGWPLTDQPE